MHHTHLCEGVVVRHASRNDLSSGSMSWGGGEREEERRGRRRRSKRIYGDRAVTLSSH